MLRSTIIASVIHSSRVNHVWCRMYKQQAFIRRPVRELDEDGKPFVDVDDVPKIEPDPKPVAGPKKNPNFKKHFKKRNNKTLGGESIEQRNEAHSFMSDVIRVVSKNDTSSIVIEGERLISDAFDAGAEIRQVYYTNDRYVRACKDIQHLIDTKKVKSQKVLESDMKLVSQVTTPPGIIAICKKPLTQNIINKRDSREILPVTVIADTIKDPGNMGGLIRSASSAAVDQVITSVGCNDVWSPKVLRSGMGAHFRIPILTSFSADAMRQMMASFEQVFYAETEQRDKDSTHGSHYFNVDYFPRPSMKTALFVGGEAFGFSEETKELLKEFNGRKLVIPMAPGTDSLNSYVAASIIIFEMRRQFMKIMMIE